MLYVHKVLFVSKLALVAVLVLALVRTITRHRQTAEVFAPSPVSATENLNAGEMSAQQPAPLTDYSAIVEHNIFCALPGTNKPVSEANDVAMRQAGPQLGLELVGTVTGGPAVARAIILKPGSKIPGLYKTGDVVAAAAIENIEKDAVVLRRNGEMMLLSMGAAKAKGMPGTEKTIASQDGKGQPTTPKDDSYRSSSDSAVVIRTGLKSIESLLRDAVIEPYSHQGQMQGMRITGLENIPGAEQTGLRNGDVIQAVNGNRLTSKKKAFQVFKKARSGPSITVDLLRGEQVRKLTFLLK